MLRIALTFVVAVLFLLGPDRQARAETYHTCKGFIDSLPATITTQGTWCLRKDLSTGMTSGSAITIATNNVTLDCNHFKIGGLAGGAGTLTHGIQAVSRTNATVRNCNIRGFYRGIHFIGDFIGSDGHLVEDNSFDGNTHLGVHLSYSPGSTIRNNRIIDTGGSTASTTVFAVGIYAQGGVDVLGNTVDGVVSTGTNADAYGIHADPTGLASSISGNRVRGLAPTGSGTPRGIYILNSGSGVISDNHVQGPGSGVIGGIGIRCLNNTATARSNVVTGFETGIHNCLSSLNAVNPN